MKMQVKAVTRTSSIDGSHIPDHLFNHSGYAEGGRIVHLECGHEFVIPSNDPAPTQFDCRYCSRVLTIEEQRENRMLHQVEAGRRLR